MSWNMFVLVLVDIYVQSSGTSMCILEGQQGGVTHMTFSSDREKLYSGGRKVCHGTCLFCF